jgi:hypothetical protein
MPCGANVYPCPSDGVVPFVRVVPSWFPGGESQSNHEGAKERRTQGQWTAGATARRTARDNGSWQVRPPEYPCPSDGVVPFVRVVPSWFPG